MHTVRSISEMKKAAFLAIVFCALNCNAFADIQGRASSWWEETPWVDPERGFNWYPDPKDEQPKAKPEEKPKTIYEMSSLEEIKKELDRIKGVAVTNPSEKNVLEFLRAQNFVMDKASTFADVSRRVVWANPDVNYSSRSPVANFARDGVKRRTDEARESNLKALAETHGILYFARSDCEFCRDQSPVLKGFSNRTGLPILTVTLDGKPITMFPDAKPDNGIAMLASGGRGIQSVPAVFLVERATQNMIPLGTGVIAGDELAERIRVLTMTTPGQEF